MGQTKNHSPKIEKHSWGSLRVGRYIYKDAKLFPGGSREWDWRETGTHHVPGIQPADVEELLNHGARIIVLSRGVYEALRVCPETLSMLKDRGVDTRVLQTEEAIRLYNELSENQPVGALIHSTC